jgi:hypothetical protein
MEYNNDMKDCMDTADSQEAINYRLNGGKKVLDFQDYYDIFLSKAKLIDKRRTPQHANIICQHTGGAVTARGGGCGRGHTPYPGRGGERAERGGGGHGTPIGNIWTGPDMVMTKGMYFPLFDYNKLTEDQKTKLRELKKGSENSPRIANSGESSAQLRNGITPLDTSSEPPSHNISHVLANQTILRPNSMTPPSRMTYRGANYHIGFHNMTHKVSNHVTNVTQGALIDSDANGGLGGKDFRILHETYERADVTGIANHMIKDALIGTGVSLIMTTTGPIIGIFNQYAYTGTVIPSILPPN